MKPNEAPIYQCMTFYMIGIIFLLNKVCIVGQDLNMSFMNMIKRLLNNGVVLKF